jgi:hypothetical protein
MGSNTVVDGVTARLGAVTASVTALVEAVRAGGLGGQGHDELSGVLGQLRGVQARLDFVNLAVVREVDVRGSFVADGALSAGAWARMHTRMPGPPRRPGWTRWPRSAAGTWGPRTRR